MSNIRDWGKYIRGGSILDDTLSGGVHAGGSSESYETDLVARARRLDSAAWTQLYERHYESVYRYVYARVSQRETAEDLASQTFLEALKSIRSYEQRGRPILAWLYRIARNVVNYHHRRSSRSAPRSAFLDDPANERLSVPDDRRDPALHVEGMDMRQALDQLSSDQRDLVILRYFVGLKTPEAAAVMGKSERAAYSLQARAIKSLRRLLKE